MVCMACRARPDRPSIRHTFNSGKCLFVSMSAVSMSAQKALATTRMGRKGVCYIPKPVREALELEEEDIIVFRVDGEEVKVEKLV